MIKSAAIKISGFYRRQMGAIAPITALGLMIAVVIVSYNFVYNDPLAGFNGEKPGDGKSIHILKWAGIAFGLYFGLLISSRVVGQTLIPRLIVVALMMPGLYGFFIFLMLLSVLYLGSWTYVVLFVYLFYVFAMFVQIYQIHFLTWGKRARPKSEGAAVIRAGITLGYTTAILFALDYWKSCYFRPFFEPC